MCYYLFWQRHGKLGNYTPHIVLSRVDEEPHAFNMLRDDENNKVLFFDTAYTVKNEKNQQLCGIYSLTNENYQKFMECKKIRPKLITPGTVGIDNGLRQYGVENDDIKKETLEK